MQLMVTSVRLAFTCSGALKRATPSEMASRPVSEDPPFAKARSKIKIAAAVMVGKKRQRPIRRLIDFRHHPDR